MSQPQEPVDPRYNEIHDLAVILKEGKATTEQLARLEDLVCHDPQARRLYTQYIYESVSLRLLTGMPDLSAAELNATASDTAALFNDTLAADTLETGATSAADHRAAITSDNASSRRWALPGSLHRNIKPGANSIWRPRAIWKRGRDFASNQTPLSMLVATFAIGLLLVVLAVWAAPTFRRFVADVPQPAPVQTTVRCIARLSGTADCRFTEGAPVFAAGDALKEGQKLHIKSGLAEVTFESGARVVLEGPVAFQVKSDKAGKLYVGRLAAHASAKAIGFEVETPHITVTDLGTEFGLAVDADGRTDVHVFEGMVSVELTASGGTPGARPVQRIVMANEAARFDPSSGTLEAAPKNVGREFVRSMPEKAKQGVTHPLVLKNPSFERPDIRRHPRFIENARVLQITAVGWHASEYPSLGAPGGIGHQGQYALSDNGERPITPAATDGNQLMWLSLDQTYPEFHEGWAYQSLGVVDQEDVGQRLRLSADVSAKDFYMSAPNGPRDGATATVAFATGVSAVRSGQTVGTSGAWPELLAENGWKTLTANLTITPEMVGLEVFVRLHVSDPEPQTTRDIYQWDNVRCVVDP